MFIFKFGGSSVVWVAMMVFLKFRVVSYATGQLDVYIELVWLGNIGSGFEVILLCHEFKQLLAAIGSRGFQTDGIRSGRHENLILPVVKVETEARRHAGFKNTDFRLFIQPGGQQWPAMRSLRPVVLEVMMVSGSDLLPSSAREHPHGHANHNQARGHLKIWLGVFGGEMPGRTQPNGSHS